MINYGRIKSTAYPKELEITQNNVFIASNITEYTENLDERIITGYEYNYIAYTKDEYIQLLNTTNAQAIAELQEELAAAKILLGVE